LRSNLLLAKEIGAFWSIRRKSALLKAKDLLPIRTFKI